MRRCVWLNPPGVRVRRRRAERWARRVHAEDVTRLGCHKAGSAREEGSKNRADRLQGRESDSGARVLCMVWVDGPEASLPDQAVPLVGSVTSAGRRAPFGAPECEGPGRQSLAAGARGRWRVEVPGLPWFLPSHDAIAIVPAPGGRAPAANSHNTEMGEEKGAAKVPPNLPLKATVPPQC